MGSLLEILDILSDQQVVLDERTAREFKLRIPIDIITDIMEIIIALIKTDRLFIGSSLPYLFFLVNRSSASIFPELLEACERFL